jgi:dolichol-phosphate mannosyltransferase
MTGKFQTLIMIPTYNEIENVEVVVSAIQSLNLDVDMLFVDDNSPDGTGALLDRLSTEISTINVLHRPGKEGVGAAHKAGIAWAYDKGYRNLLTMDADLSHSPQDIPRIMSGPEDADVIVGSRFINSGSLREWAWHRKILTHIGHILTTIFLGLPQDSTNAFRFYRLDRVPRGIFDMVVSNSYSFFYESLHRLNINGLRIAEVPIDLPARTYGHSKMRLADVLFSVTFLWRMFWKTRLEPTTMVYAEPFSGVDTGDVDQIAWDRYWSGAGHQGKWLYDLIAVFYRRFLIRPTVDRYVGYTFPAGAELLHAGCGSGMVDIGIIHSFHITALDISPRALTEYARHHGCAANLLQGSIFDIPSESGIYDGVFNLGVMEHFSEEEIIRVLCEFKRVLKPDGRIVLFWPPIYGLATRTLKLIHFVLNDVLKKGIELHPPELTHVSSRKQIEGYLGKAGFSLEKFHFGIGDMFTHQIIIAVADGLPLNSAAGSTVSLSTDDRRRPPADVAV